jgi:chemotaxis protein methyltransferase CheR
VSEIQTQIRPLTEHEFSLFRQLVETEIGIHLSSAKQALVNARLLSRIRELNLPTFSAYYERVIRSPEDELVRFINAICTNETRFFREPNQFAFLADVLLPEWQRLARRGEHPRKLRVWSSACSSGEEPYSVAMLLLHRLPAEWAVEVVATDVSTKVLERAVGATYSMERLADIPLELHQRFLLRGSGSQLGQFRMSRALCGVVQFHRENLNSSNFAHFGQFDLILCRNVLMYFKHETRRQVIQKLARQLAPGGHLFVGHSESLHDFGVGLRTVAPTIYKLDAQS